jgi:hypothetical protein
MTYPPPSIRALARDLADNLDLARNLAAGLADGLALDLDLDLARALADNLDLACGLADDLELACNVGAGPVLDFADHLELARAHAHNFADHLADSFAVGLILDLDLDIARNRGRARYLVAALEQVRWVVLPSIKELATSAPVSTAVRSRPAAMACRATGWAVRILPAAHRARWQKEYESELAELVAQGATRRQQIDYGLQVLFNAFSLRRAVAKPLPSPAKDR